MTTNRRWMFAMTAGYVWAWERGGRSGVERYSMYLHLCQATYEAFRASAHAGRCSHTQFGTIAHVSDRQDIATPMPERWGSDLCQSPLLPRLCLENEGQAYVTHLPNKPGTHHAFIIVYYFKHWHLIVPRPYNISYTYVHHATSTYFDDFLHTKIVASWQAKRTPVVWVIVCYESLSCCCNIFVVCQLVCYRLWLCEIMRSIVFFSC